ncbi:MAG TPA: hypothetical protein VN882_11675 [Steroidobacteraceae bacterium]|jgi:hypothetical protein|nr:hypothetical protein [Steroidobacteraceae bacterium]
MTSRTESQRQQGPDRSLSRVKVAIAVTDDARNQIDQVAAACRRLGLEHTSTLAGVGVLLGSVELGDLPKLRSLPRVAAVEIKREARVCALHGQSR